MAKPARTSKPKPGARRPLESRGQAWARSLSRILISLRVQPNAISVAGLGFALLGAWLLAAGPGKASAAFMLLLAAACVQLRLLCNLMDGMVAIEGGLKSPTGDIYNEVPDRLADLALLLGAGYGLPYAWGPALGWAAGAAAILTAYIRLFGGTLGLPQDFRGPQAKPHRMFLLTLSALAAALGAGCGCFAPAPVLAAGLGLILLGTVATFLRRLWAIRQALLAA